MKQFEAVCAPNVWSPASLRCNGEKGARVGLYLQRYPITAAGINFPTTFPCSLDENLSESTE